MFQKHDTVWDFSSYSKLIRHDDTVIMHKSGPQTRTLPNASPAHASPARGRGSATLQVSHPGPVRASITPTVPTLQLPTHCVCGVCRSRGPGRAQKRPLCLRRARPHSPVPPPSARTATARLAQPAVPATGCTLFYCSWQIFGSCSSEHVPVVFIYLLKQERNRFLVKQGAII